MSYKMEIESLLSERIEFRDIIAIFSILALIATCSWNYNYVEREKIDNEDEQIVFDAKQYGVEVQRLILEREKSVYDKSNLELNQSKFLIDISKLINDLRPKISGGCNAYLISPIQIAVDCVFKNQGSQGVSLAAPIVRLKIKNSNVFVNTKYYRQVYAVANYLPTGIEGANSIILKVSDRLDWSKIEIATEINSVTDDPIVSFAKLILKEKSDYIRFDNLIRQTSVFSTQLTQNH